MNNMQLMHLTSGKYTTFLNKCPFLQFFCAYQGAFYSALIITFVAFYFLIPYVRAILGARARLFAPERHKQKDYTPTMGGLLIALGIISSSFFFLSYSVPIVFGALFIFSAHLIIGTIDDWAKIRGKKELSIGQKFTLQSIISIISLLFLLFYVNITPTIFIPGISVFISLSPWCYLLWGMCVLVGTSNAVNLTDGLDGLAVGSLVPNYFLYALFAFSISGNVAALAPLMLAVIGALGAFCWFNVHPARIFMGDVGSLSLGALLGYCALVTKQELLLIISGILFVVETVSVIIQIAWYSFYKKRFFKMAPLHHHFELNGWAEATIVAKSTLITLLACTLALTLFCISKI